jgi:hypothetical protein
MPSRGGSRPRYTSRRNWSDLKYLLVITLKHDAYGFFGGFTQMARLDAGKTSRRFGNEGGGLGAQTKGFTSEGMKERIAKYGSRGTLAGGGTQFYIPNVRMINVATWSCEDLSLE